jgi:hypothetical protein
MKKYYFFAALATVGLFASCSSDEDFSDASEARQALSTNDNVGAPIKIYLGGIGNSRGSGTVGSNDAATNHWAGQKINVYMYETGTFTLAKDDNNVALYENAVLTTPLTGVGDALLVEIDPTTKDETTTYRYFTDDKIYDFWGYRTDGAEGTNTPAVNGTKLQLDFVIDGSQDIMVAKAAPKAAANGTTKETANIGEALANGKVVGEYGGARVEIDPAKLYSGYTSRRQVNPRLNFKHLLSRFYFTVKGANAAVCDPTTGIKVKSIEVETVVDGTLNIASTDDTEQSIEWGNTTDYVALKQRPALVTAMAEGSFFAVTFSIDATGNVTFTSPASPAFGTIPLTTALMTYDEAEGKSTYDGLPNKELGTIADVAAAAYANAGNAAVPSVTVKCWRQTTAPAYDATTTNPADGLIPLKAVTPELSAVTYAWTATDADHYTAATTKAQVKTTETTADAAVSGYTTPATAADAGKVIMLYTDEDDDDAYTDGTDTPLAYIIGAVSGGTPTETEIGEALLVAPGQATYKLKVTVEQEVITQVVHYADGTTPDLVTKAVKPITFEKTIKIPTSGTPQYDGDGNLIPTQAVAGRNYKINLTLNGIDGVSVSDSDITVWDDEPTEVDIDDDDE